MLASFLVWLCDKSFLYLNNLYVVYAFNLLIAFSPHSL